MKVFLYSFCFVGGFLHNSLSQFFSSTFINLLLNSQIELKVCLSSKLRNRGDKHSPAKNGCHRKVCMNFEAHTVLTLFQTYLTLKWYNFNYRSWIYWAISSGVLLVMCILGAAIVIRYRLLQKRTSKAPYRVLLAASDFKFPQLADNLRVSIEYNKLNKL